MKRKLWSKKSIKVILIIMILSILKIYVTMRFTFLPVIVMEVIQSAKTMSDKDMNKYFSSNKNDFDNVIEMFKEYPYIRYINNESHKGGKFLEYKTKRGFFILSEKELTDNVLEDIDNSGVIKIMNEMKLKEIWNPVDYIQFTQSSSVSDCSGLFYIPNVEVFNTQSNNAELYNIKQISSEWYIFHIK